MGRVQMAGSMHVSGGVQTGGAPGAGLYGGGPSQPARGLPVGPGQQVAHPVTPPVRTIPPPRHHHATRVLDPFGRARRTLRLYWGGGGFLNSRVHADTPAVGGWVAATTTGGSFPEAGPRVRLSLLLDAHDRERRPLHTRAWPEGGDPAGLYPAAHGPVGRGTRLPLHSRERERERGADRLAFFLQRQISRFSA